MIGLLCLLVAVVSCNSFSFSQSKARPLNSPWTIDDLRRLDPADASSPCTDILAVYMRTTDLTVDIRVDLLDINPGDAYRLEVSLWDDRDFFMQPLNVEIDSSGKTGIRGTGSGSPGIHPRVVQDFAADDITISINRFLIGKHVRVDVSSYGEEANLPADQVLNVGFDEVSHPKPAPLIMAFWNSYPASTPTLALRRWAGAHTGPVGGRHGLKYVLEAARQYQVPVTLLDLKNPSSLAALDFMQLLPTIKNMLAENLLILPEDIFSQPGQTALQISRNAASAYGLPSSRLVYTASAGGGTPAIPTGIRGEFARLADATHLQLDGDARLIPLPAENTFEATRDGPALEARRALIAAAISSDPGDLIVLGGDLPNSTWGDVEMAGPSFAWIAAHPWIRALGEKDILAFPALPQPEPPAPTPVNTPWLKDLQAAPANSVTQTAWQTYLRLNAPTADEKLSALREAYLGQVGELLAVADWANAPAARIDCLEDLNGDGRPECILADRNYFAVIETDGARVTQFFARDEQGTHQWIGPSSQFTVGLSDPSEWDPSQGEAADPSVIPGAFTDGDAAWQPYTPALLPDGIAFTRQDGMRAKTFRLTGDGLSVAYAGGPVSTRIPLAVDPLVFFSGPSYYRASLAPGSWTWGLQAGENVQVLTTGSLSAQGFISALPFISLLEDPNFDYPWGDSLPFPLSLVKIQAPGDFSVQIVRLK